MSDPTPDGYAAVAAGLRLARVQAFSTGPGVERLLTLDRLADYVAEDSPYSRKARFGSEAAALAWAAGAEMTGLRSGTLAFADNLPQMHEVCTSAADFRLPLLMILLSAPPTESGDVCRSHQGGLLARDQAWLQFYPADAQELLDLLLIAYRVAEDPGVLLPAMLCLDAFFLPQGGGPWQGPAPEAAEAFLPPYERHEAVRGPNGPQVLAPMSHSPDCARRRYWQNRSQGQASAALALAMKDFRRVCGRDYAPVESYRCQEAEAVLVMMGSSAGEARRLVDRYRQAGRRVGLLRLLVYRPFPSSEIAEALEGVEYVGVLDRTACPGYISGPLGTELRSSLSAYGLEARVSTFVAGLAGQEVSETALGRIFDFLLAGHQTRETLWLDIADEERPEE